MKRQVVLALLLSPLCATAQKSMPNQTRLLTEEEAKHLAIIALPQGTTALPGFSLEDSPNPGTCISFDGTWDDPKGSVHIDFWTVNRRSGEVWRGVDPVCHRVSSPALREAQKRVRKELGVSTAEVKQEHKRVCCLE